MNVVPQIQSKTEKYAYQLWENNSVIIISMGTTLDHLKYEKKIFKHILFELDVRKPDGNSRRIICHSITKNRESKSDHVKDLNKICILSMHSIEKYWWN